MKYIKAHTLLKDEPYFKITDLENVFNISIDKNQNYVYNLNETLVINIAESELTEIICDHPTYWTQLSYVLFGSTRLAWILMKINHVSALGMFEIIQPGDTVKVPSGEIVSRIVNAINGK